jgi:hypothetical protein
MGSVVIRSAANEVFQMSDFVTAGDTRLNVTVDHLSLRKILWSTDGEIAISRQVTPANVVIFNLTYSGVFDLDALGIASNGALDYTSSNLIIQHTSANSVVVIKGKKGTVPQAEWNNNIVPGLH